jgi:hypothetical protein
MNNNFYGIGKRNTFHKTYDISIFLGNTYLTIAFYTKIYKFLPRFYYYNEEAFKYLKDMDIFSLKWFFGFIK